MIQIIGKILKIGTDISVRNTLEDALSMFYFIVVAFKLSKKKTKQNITFFTKMLKRSNVDLRIGPEGDTWTSPMSVGSSSGYPEHRDNIS